MQYIRKMQHIGIFLKDCVLINVYMKKNIVKLLIKEKSI